MDEFEKLGSKLPLDQQAIRAKCFHPTGTFVEFPEEEVEQSIPARFEKIVRTYPNSVALRVLNAEITYAALNKAANRAAHSITERFGESSEPIVVLLEEGIDALAAMMGVLKARRFYIPLAPSLPRLRLFSILKDSGARVVITDEKNQPLVKEFALGGGIVIRVSELDGGSSSENPGFYVSPRALCSIRYTSGTSGDPKGVMHTHRKVLHAANVNTNSLHLSHRDRFAAHGHDYFNSLLIGAPFFLYKISENGWTRFSTWLIENEITTYDTVPTLFRQFCSTLGSACRFPHLRLIKLEGEPALKEDMELYKRYFPDDCILVNRLGARETGGFRQFFVDKSTRIDRPALPAGYAFAAKDVLLLSDDRETVGVGRPGEIAVVSEYLATGYWQRPDLTKAAFLPVDVEGARIKFLTGDLGRFDKDGCLEYLGRKDDQIKLGGEKIHAAEIETALSQCGGVKEAVVKLWKINVEEPCLTAYVVSDQAVQLDIRQLRLRLRQKFPSCMVPSKFVFLDALPLGPTGKIDRLALPKPGHARPLLHNRYAPSTTPTEEQLCRIWAEVLDLDQVGIHDDFFDLGGHSLSAMRVIHRVLQVFKSELSIKALFEAPTVAEMATVVMKNQTKPASEAQLAGLLRQVEAMTEEEVKKQLAEQGMQS